ncbi:MAG: hypothetical protein SGCHY_000270 [Lobulomycetales sp.]
MLEPGTILTHEGPKVQVIQQSDDGACATFAIADEDHTIGNALRYIIMKNPKVSFAAYTLPHPSETRLNLRIQTDGSQSPKDALMKGLDDLEIVFQHLHDSFKAELAGGSFEILDGADPSAE